MLKGLAVYSIVSILFAILLIPSGLILPNMGRAYAVTPIFHPSVRLTATPGSSEGPSLAYLDSSHLYVVWQDDTPGNNDIFFISSSDGGTTWSTKKNLSHDAADSLIPRVVVSGTDLVVFWEEERNGNNDIFLTRSIDGGATWSPKTNLSNNAGYSTLYNYWNEGSTIHLVWLDDTPGNNDIFYRVSTDGGATWSIKKNLTNNPGESQLPFIQPVGSNLYLSWSDNTPGNFDIFYKVSTDNGATWSKAKNLSNSAGNSFAFTGIWGNGTNLYAAYQDDTKGNNEVFLRESTDGGATWSPKTNLSNNAGDSVDPIVLVSGNHVYFSWIDNATGNYDLFFRSSNDSGVTWSTKKNLSNDLGNSIGVAGLNLFSPDDNTLYAIWFGNTTGNNDIFFKYSEDYGATWSTKKNLSNDLGNSIGLGMLARNNDFYVLWQDDTKGNNEVYFKKITTS